MATSSPLQERVVEGYRPSPQQRRLWALQQRGLPCRSLCAVRIEGELDKELLRDVLTKLVKRHDILRTALAMPAGSETPLQVIGEQLEFQWGEIDLSASDRRVQKSRIEQILNQEQARDSNLQGGPVLRICLLGLTPHRHLAILSLPSLCADSRSLVNLVEQLSRTYAACRQGREDEQEMTQYLQFSEFQNQLLEEEEDAQEGIEYWRQRFAPRLAELRLPFARPSSDGRFEAELVKRRIDSSLPPRIDRLARRYGTPKAAWMLACWHTLLWRLTGQADIALGCAFECREYEALQQALGLFAKWLPVPFHFEDSFRFEEVLRRLGDQSEESAEWQDYFVFEDHPAEAGEAGPDCFSAGFEFQESPVAFHADRLSLSIQHHSCPLERFDILLVCLQQEGSTQAEYHYNARRFRTADIESLADSFETLLKHSLDNPGMRICELDVLSPEDRSQLLGALTQTGAEFPQRCVHEFFEQQAARTPDRIAAVFNDRQVSYAELERRAGRLAGLLRQNGIRPGHISALFLEPSLEIIISILGVLKAGGAYLPINLMLPEQGIELALEYARPAVLISHSDLLDRLPESRPPVVLAESSSSSPLPVLPPSDCGASPQDLAYVLLTPAPTGGPKGVAVEHRQIANYLQAILSRLEVAPQTSFALLSSLSADLDNTSLYACLASGGCLNVISQKISSKLLEIDDYFRYHSIDFLSIVPSRLAALQAVAHPHRIMPNKCLLLNGEASRWDWACKLQEMAPQCTIFNHYGAAEAAVGAMTYRLQPDKSLPDSCTSLPLGRPLANQQVYLLDPRLQPVPRWVEGELYIGGDGVSRGYLGQPRLTANSFLPDPFSKQPGGRLYRTGDRARYLPGAGIEFVGRADRQVKLNGLRVELDEIKGLLEEHPAVQEAALLIREDQPVDQKLASFIVPRRSVPNPLASSKGRQGIHTFSASQLRRHLLRRLPEYMVPAHIVALSSLPAQPNGKVDRAALAQYPLQRRPRQSVPRIVPTQRHWLKDAVLQEQLDYWRERIQDAPALDLPTDRPRAAMQSHREAVHHFALPEGLSQALWNLSQGQDSTPFATLLAAFKLLLFRYTGQTDILVGSPVTVRSRDETESFPNIVALRTALTGKLDFPEVMRRVGETALGAFGHQEMPFEQLVDALQPDRSALIKVMFALEATGLERNEIGRQAASSRPELTLSMREQGSRLTGAVEYAAELFAPSTIRRLSRYLHRLLLGIVDGLRRPIGEISILSRAEQWQLLGEWNDTSNRYPRHETIAGLFEEQAVDRPDSVAVVCGRCQLSYASLDGQAGRMARCLSQEGLGAESVAGLFADRSLQMMVGLLAIVKSGAAYLPLDPGYPQDRIARMLADSRPSAVLVQQGLERQLPAGDWKALSLQPVPARAGWGARPITDGKAEPESLAYLVYTSGSTGVPKGVAIPHRGVVRLVKETGYAVLGPQESILLMAPISFDASTFELWGSLLNGGRLVVPPPGTPTLKQLGGLILQHGISTLHLSAVLFHLMVQENPAPLTRLRQLYAGGDVLSPQRVRTALESGLACLVDSYGPSENTTYTSCHLMRRTDDEWDSVPIGHPVPNTTVYVLDEQHSPLPVGVPGELHCGGDGLARGYFGRPGATAASFVPHPFAWGERLYRSGDLVRWRRDGTLEFLGRQDHQVKVRGYRIELGEIEARLGEHPQVQHCAVLAQGEVAELRRLAAYLSCRTDSAPGESDLREFLKQRLPEYMVPSTFQVLEELPLNPSGKVDRQALKSLKAEKGQELAVARLGGHNRPFVAPRDILELQLAQVWEDVLEVGPIGVLDDFFELGGHSLLAVHLLSRIESATGHRIPLNALFQESTIEYLANRLRQQSPPAATPLVRLQPKGTRPPLFLVHPGGGGVFSFIGLAWHLAPEQPLIGLQAPELDGAEPCADRIEDMAQRYSEAVQQQQPQGPYFLGGHSIGGLVAFEMARQLQAKGESIALVALLDSKVLPSGQRGPKLEEASMAVNFGLSLGLTSDSLPLKAMANQAPEQRLTLLYEQVRQQRLIPPRLERERFRLLFDLFRSHSRAARRYRPDPAPLRIVYFAADRPFRQALQGVAGNLLKKLSKAFSKPAQEWNDLASLGVEVRQVPGDHFSMLREPHVQVLAQQLMSHLQEAMESKEGKFRTPDSKEFI